jgi:hybrid polyketide synthase / nonribosomal peptide synthetase ACE1
LLKSEKVVSYEGDLARPRLGLSEQDHQEIFSTADAIIHNGADVFYTKTYESLRLPNVQVTRELVEMGMARMIPFHYIFSGGACSFAAAKGPQSVGPQFVASYPPPVDGKLGYASSKWASEVLREKLQTQHPASPIWVHRPSNIACIDTPQLDLVYNLKWYSRLIRAVPITRGKVQGMLNSVPLDTVVQGIWMPSENPGEVLAPYGFYIALATLT